MTVRSTNILRAEGPLLPLGALLLVLTLTLGAPLLMVVLADVSLPWARLAEVGEAFGGASALLSAIALSGVAASLLFQQRQIRQQIADIDRQHHMELLKLAIENPELIEVLDQETASRPHPRHELYANSTMMYWLTLWELGEIDDDELRNMTSRMFRSELTREWWARFGDVWIGARVRPQRRRFMSIVSEEMRAAEIAAAKAGGGSPRAGRSTPAMLAAVGVLAAGTAFCGYLYGRRMRPSRTSSMKDRQESDR